MSSHFYATSLSQKQSERAARPLRVLVVDPSPGSVQLAKACVPTEVALRIARVGTLKAGRRYITTKPVDVAIIESDLPDGSGLALSKLVNRRYRRIDSIFISAKPTLEAAMKAVRHGAADFLTKPIDSQRLAGCLRSLVDDRLRQRDRNRRIRRLRRACRQLDQSRREVTHQVDVLCEDLIGAYQELADQMQHSVSRREFEAAIRDELDLDPLLRKTLTFLLDKTGPANAAIFLPAIAMDEFSLRGYVNYDRAGEAAELLMQQLTDVLAPQVACREEPMHLTDDEQIARHLGGMTYLLGCEILAFGVQAEGEPLAAVVLFRDRSEPFDASMIQACTAISAPFGERLVKLIRIHYRATMTDDQLHYDENL